MKILCRNMPSLLRFLGTITGEIVSQKISKKEILNWLTRRYNKILLRRGELRHAKDLQQSY